MREKSLGFLISTLIFGMSSHYGMAHEDPAASPGQDYQVLLAGDAGFGRSCYLGVLEEGVDQDGFYYAVVETSFQHDGEGPGVLLVKPTGSNFLAGVGENGSQISIQLLGEAQTIESAVQYAVRWSHDGHIDSGRCNDLVLVYEDHD